MSNRKNQTKRPTTGAFFQCGAFKLPLTRPLIMGIVNLTDDSFSGDGHGSDIDHAVNHAQQLIKDGADILDIGAESTRPGAQYQTAEHELSRLLPVIERLRDCGRPISIDTNKPEVMRAVIQAGAAMINDIRGLEAPGAIDAIADTDAGVCIMHMQSDPKTMQQNPVYEDVAAEIRDYLMRRVDECLAAGIDASRLCIDPGFGFGKTVAHNVALFQHLPDFIETQYPLLVGVSRKSFLGALTGLEVHERTTASVTAALLAAQSGAKILRVHDVKETKTALTLWSHLNTMLSTSGH